MPCVLKSLDLSCGLLAGRRFEQNVVAGVRVEWRIKVYKIDTFSRDALAKYGEVVAIKELVCHRRPRRCRAFFLENIFAGLRETNSALALVAPRDEFFL